VEALTRGLMNKFLHLPLQALKTAAREGDASALEAIGNVFARECAAQKAEQEKELAAAVPEETNGDSDTNPEKPMPR
jgi:glutamyl-tRNA reductase